MPGEIAFIVEWLLLAAGLVLISLPAVYLRFPWLAAVALGLSFALWVRRTRQLLPPTSLNLPWLLFILTTAWGAYISIAQDLAQAQFVRLLAAFVVFCAFLASSARGQRYIAWMLLASMAILALYWPLTHSFASDSGKFSLVSQAGKSINAVLPELPGPYLTSNTVGGMLALAVPFGIALAWIGWKEKRRDRATLALALTSLVLVGLTFTSSRGAMLGLLASAVLAVLAYLQTRWFSGKREKAIFWGALGLLLVASAFWLVFSGQLERLVGAVPDPPGSLQSRVEIWRQGLLLMRDYTFTGAGLGTFRLVFSIYSLLIHVPYHDHMHNLFLQTWFEQGILGLVVLVWGMLVVLRLAWRAPIHTDDQTGFDERAVLRALGWAGMAALLAMGVHGMVDVVFMLKRSLPLVGVVLAYAALLEGGQGIREAGAKGQVRTGRWVRIMTGAGLAALLLLLLFYRPLLGAWHANLGALAQTRLELSLYNPDQFDQPTLDQIRRESDFSSIETSFARALHYDPTNRTAITRLASLALSRGDHATALALLEQGQASSERDPVMRLLYGDVLVAQGRLEEAVNILRGMPWAADRLLFQAKYRYWNRGDSRRAGNAWLAVLRMEPDNQEAKGWLLNVR